MSEPTEPETALATTEAPAFSMNGERMRGIDPAKLMPYNFRNPGFLSEADLRQLGAIYSRYIQHLSARLSIFLRMECVLKLAEFTSVTFEKYCESLATPTHLALFQVEPLRGVGIVEMRLPLGLAMADRLLGGKGRAAGTDRGLTEIEIALLEDAMLIMLAEWTQLWGEDYAQCHAQVIGHESSARFLTTSAADAVFAVATFDVTLGEVTEKMQLGIPLSMIEGPVKKMQLARQRGGDLGPRQAKWRTPYAGIAVPITAEWQVRDMTLNEAMRLSAGSVIELSRDLVSQTRVRLSNTEEFVGTVGQQNGRLAVQLTQRTFKD